MEKVLLWCKHLSFEKLFKMNCCVTHHFVFFLEDFMEIRLWAPWCSG